MKPRQRAFVGYFIGESAGNVTDAARRAGYVDPNSNGHRLMRVPEIQEAVSRALDEFGMRREEIIARLSDLARADPKDFLSRDEATGKLVFDLDKAERLGKLHLLDIQSTPDGLIRSECRTALKALRTLAKVRGLLVDHVQIEVSQPADDAGALILAKLARVAETLPAADRAILQGTTVDHGRNGAVPGLPGPPKGR